MSLISSEQYQEWVDLPPGRNQEELTFSVTQPLSDMGRRTAHCPQGTRMNEINEE